MGRVSNKNKKSEGASDLSNRADIKVIVSSTLFFLLPVVHARKSCMESTCNLGLPCVSRIVLLTENLSIVCPLLVGTLLFALTIAQRVKRETYYLSSRRMAL